MTALAPSPRRWSRDEYYRLAELGVFQDLRVELIEGEIIVMPAQRESHATLPKLTERAVERAFGPGYFARVQCPLDLLTSVPEPDIAVVSGDPRDYLSAHPTSALLLVEISEATLHFDRHTKGPVYAAAGLADYWIVNLVDRRLEVYRDPVSVSGPHGIASYRSVRILHPGEAVEPLAAPGRAVAVSDLLP